MRISILIAIILLVAAVANVNAETAKVYYVGYGFIAVGDDSTPTIWKAQINLAQKANDSQYKVWKQFTNDWCDVLEMIDPNADLTKDFQNRWNDPSVGKAIRGMADLARERRAAIAAVKEAAVLKKAKLDRQDKMFLKMAADSTPTDTVRKFQKAWSDYENQVKLASDNGRRYQLATDFRNTWSPLADSLATRQDELAAKEAQFADLKGIVTYDEFKTTIAALDKRISELEKWRQATTAQIATFATTKWVTDNFKGK